jgi:hypothetical protein
MAMTTIVEQIRRLASHLAAELGNKRHRTSLMPMVSNATDSRRDRCAGIDWLLAPKCATYRYRKAAEGSSQAIPSKRKLSVALQRAGGLTWPPILDIRIGAIGSQAFEEGLKSPEYVQR